MTYTLDRKRYLQDASIPLVVVRTTVSDNVEMHAHEFSELVIITGGQGLHVTGQETWPIAAGDVFVITGQCAHAYRNSGNLSLVNILYDADKLLVPARELRILSGYNALFTLEPGWRRKRRFKSRLRLSIKDLARVNGMIDSMILELRDKAPGYQLMARTTFLQLAGFLSRCYDNVPDDNPRDLVRIAQAISHLERHYCDPIYLDEVARIAHMSRRNFLRVFREAMGASPIEYLVALRIARAAELLRNEPDTVTGIAFRVGFEDSNYFSRCFRKQMGFTPVEYRRRNI
ncbi:MAG: AraC family transcriptional regulator [Verrucomicrobia bacterium]|nr:AraC family transcriptional regulator [Verrucomicrobiota bacterium]